MKMIYWSVEDKGAGESWFHVHFSTPWDALGHECTGKPLNHETLTVVESL